MDKTKGRVVHPKVEANVIPDPGTGIAIPIGKSGQVPLVIANAVEANTLAAPAFRGQELVVYAYSVAGSGTRAITVSEAFNVAGNTIMTFNAGGDLAILLGSVNATGLVWKIIANDGVALS